MMAHYDGEKTDPADVVRAALDGVEAGRFEVLADEWSAGVKASLAGDPSEFHTLPEAGRAPAAQQGGRGE
ncbi:hypothetical protein [Streptomyces sp. NPDC090798]|uniref:hypothetical protein n=1 Tax=Streptomyces sp. NPDC090798 TaxID=3365968 RepID=UPI00382A1DD1